MKSTSDISKAIQQLRAPASAGLDERVRNAVGQAKRSAPADSQSAEPTFPELLRTFMKKKSTRYTLGTALGVALLAALILHQSTTSAWAIEDAIKALQKFKAVHIMGFGGAGAGSAPLEIWARADATGTHSDACLAKSDTYTAWVKNDKTYTYLYASNTVLVNPGVTIGLNPWFGPHFLTTLSRMPDFREYEGSDPATGQKRVLVTGSIRDAHGPQSFLIEFDAGTKLPVSLKWWFNLERRGAPNFYFEKIVYFADLPDSAFSFEPPRGARFVDRPLTIPEANLATLSDPKSGISANGMTREEACRKILEQFWAAWIKDDLSRVRQLCPLTANLPDKLLHNLADQDKAVELLQVGGIEQEGQSKLGPLAMVPCRVACKDGKVREIRMVVQFRQANGDVSCVVHGPYGNSVEVNRTPGR